MSDDIKRAVLEILDAAKLSTPSTDTISVPLNDEDFDLIERMCEAAMAAIDNAPHDRIAELRDRLKRARLP